LYDPAARKFIISGDVQFMKNEAWDGRITKTVKIIDVMEHEDMEKEVNQTPCISQCAIPSTLDTGMQIQTQTTPVRSTGA
jgi:hypothetical protein